MKVPEDPGWFLREGGFQRCLGKREGLVSRGVAIPVGQVVRNRIADKRL